MFGKKSQPALPPARGYGRKDVPLGAFISFWSRRMTRSARRGKCLRYLADDENFLCACFKLLKHNTRKVTIPGIETQAFELLHCRVQQIVLSRFRRLLRSLPLPCNAIIRADPTETFPGSSSGHALHRSPVVSGLTTPCTPKNKLPDVL